MRIPLYSMHSMYFLVIGLTTVSVLLTGCEVRPKPFVHLVEYRSSSACMPESADCPWEKLQREAEFSALVNCLLAGANVLETREEGEKPEGDGVRHVVAPLPPRYGYERGRTGSHDGASCPAEAPSCSVASRYDREFTWATCGSRPLTDAELRGGEDVAHADRITETVVLTGILAQANDDFRPPDGLDGPDHVYRFTLTERTRIEAAVAANRAIWSGVVGLVQSAWQPAFSLLSSDGTRLQQGYVLRAGVTALFPSELEPGTYYLVVDSSISEWKRGDGLYRLYVGFDQSLMGPAVPRKPIRQGHAKQERHHEFSSFHASLIHMSRAYRGFEKPLHDRFSGTCRRPIQMSDSRILELRE
ncbi:MAG: hypothetical protein MRJ68_17620 [Nitrospira sp.]|nr:hypothetical protein [Nitrospira sp.]